MNNQEYDMHKIIVHYATIKKPGNCTWLSKSYDVH
jgi:hypothetical protein